MAGQGIHLAAITVGKDLWFNLAHHGEKHMIRFYTKHSEKRAQEPSGHKLWEIVVEGSVKWMPRDPSTLNITDIPPLGPTKKR